MKLAHSFTVPAPVDEAWSVLRDVERIAPCMPGATIDSVDGEEFSGRVKVKVGSMTVTYRGDARFVDVDEAGHRATIEASGKEARGSGTARATITAELTASGEQTDVALTTELTITGKPAQFGRGVMADVGGKLVSQFADCLSSELGKPDEPAEAAAAATAMATATGQSTQPAPPALEADHPPAGRPSAESIDLLDVAGASVGKRLAPLAAVLAAVALVVWYLRRRSS